MKSKLLMTLALLTYGIVAMPALALDDSAKARLSAVDKITGYDAILAPLSPADLADALVYLRDVKKLPVADVVQLANAVIAKKPVADQAKYLAAVKAVIPGLAADANGKLILVSGSAPRPSQMSPSPINGSDFGIWIDHLRGGSGNGHIIGPPKGVSRP